MNIIGFNFTKLSGQHFLNYKEQNFSMNTNIEFLDVQKEDVAALKDKEAIKLVFTYTVSFGQKEKEAKGKEAPKLGEVSFEGNILLSADKDEAKEVLKAWKKKEIPVGFKVPIFNLILKKCTAKALQLEDEINLPAHIPLPTLSFERKEEEKK